MEHTASFNDIFLPHIALQSSLFTTVPPPTDRTMPPAVLDTSCFTQEMQQMEHLLVIQTTHHRQWRLGTPALPHMHVSLAFAPAECYLPLMKIEKVVFLSYFTQPETLPLTNLVCLPQCRS